MNTTSIRPIPGVHPYIPAVIDSFPSGGRHLFFSPSMRIPSSPRLATACPTSSTRPMPTMHPSSHHSRGASTPTSAETAAAAAAAAPISIRVPTTPRGVEEGSVLPGILETRKTLICGTEGRDCGGVGPKDLQRIVAWVAFNPAKVESARFPVSQVAALSTQWSAFPKSLTTLLMYWRRWRRHWRWRRCL